MAKPSYPRPVWRFQCECDQIAANRYRMKLTSVSGQEITAEGYHPMHMLIRALGSTPEQEARRRGETFKREDSTDA